MGFLTFTWGIQFEFTGFRLWPDSVPAIFGIWGVKSVHGMSACASLSLSFLLFLAFQRKQTNNRKNNKKRKAERVVVSEGKSENSGAQNSCFSFWEEATQTAGEWNEFFHEAVSLEENLDEDHCHAHALLSAQWYPKQRILLLPAGVLI